MTWVTNSKLRHHISLFIQICTKPEAFLAHQPKIQDISTRQLRPKILARQHSYQLLQVQPCWNFNNSIREFRVPPEPRFVLVPIGFTSEALPRPGLAEPRSASIAGFGLFHQHIRKGKIVITKTSKEKRPLLDSFSALETDMIFGDGVKASLVRGPYWVVILCDVDALLH